MFFLKTSHTGKIMDFITCRKSVCFAVGLKQQRKSSYLSFYSWQDKNLGGRFFVSFDRSEDSTPYGRRSFAFKLSFSCRIFRFSRLSIVSLLCELISTIRLSAACVVAPYWDPITGIKQTRFLRKVLKMETVSVRAHCIPVLVLPPIS
jgi:hypothetical protein